MKTYVKPMIEIASYEAEQIMVLSNVGAQDGKLNSHAFADIIW